MFFIEKIEVLLMTTHNICFDEEVEKTCPRIIIKYSSRVHDLRRTGKKGIYLVIVVFYIYFLHAEYLYTSKF